jgi:predicted GNAT family acetyltransferase
MSVVSHDATAHQFTADVDGHRALLDYTLDDSVMSITHTRVPTEIGGRGVAAQLMKAALAAAHDHGWQVTPVCSYAVAYMRKHSLLNVQNHLDALLDEALDESFPASDSPSVGGSS